MKHLIYVFTFLWAIILQGQTFVQGKILISEAGQTTPASGAEVYWQEQAVGVVSSDDGRFAIPYKPENKKLIVTFLGYKTQVVNITNSNDYLTITLEDQANSLDAVEIIQKRKATEKFLYKTANIININSSELLKAACCNLSDSFETNATVDVSVSDAVTGNKQIKMLGLSSPYILISQENTPVIRGVSQAFGLTFIPGTWVESIQITKGTGSVINGYESIAGQINTELVKPITDKRFFLNLYTADDGRLELNAHFNKHLSKNWATGLYVHANNKQLRMDMNDDHFLDTPLGNQINIMNRWQYINTNTGWSSAITFNYLKDNRLSGEKEAEKAKRFSGIWVSNTEINQFQSQAKLGYIWKELPFQSIGFQGLYKYYTQNSFYGLNYYNIKSHTGYFNSIFSSIIGNTNNKFSTGISATFDGIDENIHIFSFDEKFDIEEYSIGAFFEYSSDLTEKLSLTVGLRTDTHNQMGVFITPRVNIRYIPWEKASLRFSAGKGQRSASVFAENQKFFSSSRHINLNTAFTKNSYKLDAEKAWNFGISLLQKFNFLQQDGDISIDFYRTDFTNQIVVDWENPQTLSFYNLDSKSYANSMQVELNYQIIKQLSLRTAYKYYDIETSYQSGHKTQPLSAKHRFFANLAYDTTIRNGKQWRFDYTFNTIGKQRLPSTATNPKPYVRGNYSKAYNLMNTQITRAFASNLEAYLGVENLTDYKQKNAIIASDTPFSSYFDTTAIYAPVSGRMIYLGIRYHLK